MFKNLIRRVRIYFHNKKLDKLESRVKKVQAMEKAIPNIKETILTKREKTNKRKKNRHKNKKCICGSGKKFKKCCWYKLERKPRLSDGLDLDKMG